MPRIPDAIVRLARRQGAELDALEREAAARVRRALGDSLIRRELSGSPGLDEQVTRSVAATGT